LPERRTKNFRRGLTCLEIEHAENFSASVLVTSQTSRESSGLEKNSSRIREFILGWCRWKRQDDSRVAPMNLTVMIATHPKITCRKS